MSASQPEPTADRPRLRPLEFKPVEYEGERYLFLRDPLRLSDQTLLIPEPFIPLLTLMDGTRDLSGLQFSLSLRYRLRMTRERIQALIASLDEACLLENARARNQQGELLSSYRRASARPPSLAGSGYPAEPDALSELLDRYLVESQEPAPQKPVRGVISPHIDYDRGAPVYAAAWQAAATAARRARLVILLGTDHFSEGLPFTLTRVPYATPYGTLPLPDDLVDELAAAMGPSAFTGELHHRTEHSIELASVWLHHVRRREPVAVLPLLVGSLGDLDGAPQSSWEHSLYQRVISILRRECFRAPTLVVAAADLSHVGPAFGDSAPNTPARDALSVSDRAILDVALSGRSRDFYQAVQANGDRTRICGLAPITMLLDVLASPGRSTLHSYAICPADDTDTSFVSIAAATFE